MEQNDFVKDGSALQPSAFSIFSKLPISLNSRPAINAIASSLVSYTKGQFLGGANIPGSGSIVLKRQEEDIVSTSGQKQQAEETYEDLHSRPKFPGDYPQHSPMASEFNISYPFHKGSSGDVRYRNPSYGAPQYPNVFEPLNPDEDSSPVNTQETVQQIDVPSKTPIEMLYSISQIVFRGREAGTRHMLRRYISGGNVENETNIETQEIGQENESLESTTHTRSLSVRSDAAATNTADYQPSVGLCQCAYCLRERELKWQLFLLQEEQRSKSENPCSSKVPINQTPKLPSYPDQKSLYQHQSQRGRYVHNVASKLVYTAILAAHATYPHIKAFVREILAFEGEHKVLERFVKNIVVSVKNIVVSMVWFYQIVLTGIMKLILLIFGRREVVSGSELPKELQDVRDQDMDQVNRWLVSTAGQLISGACEGVELGLDTCRQRNVAKREII